MLLLSGSIYAQCVPCGTVKTIEVDLSEKADTTWTYEDLKRDGECCGSAANETCVKFEVTLNPRSNEVSFDIAKNPASAEYKIDCGDPHGLRDTVCVNGVTEFCIVF